MPKETAVLRFTFSLSLVIGCIRGQARIEWPSDNGPHMLERAGKGHLKGFLVSVREGPEV